MNRPTIGAILLISSGVFASIATTGAKLAAAIDKGAFQLSKVDGRIPTSPDEADPHWLATAMVLVLAAAGLRLLFSNTKPE